MIQKSIIVHDPWYFIWVLGNTLWTKHEFYIQSTIGIFGWLDTPLPSIFYYGFAVLFGMVIAKIIKNSRQRTPIGLVVLMTCIFIGTIAGIMYYFYIYGTPVASPFVDSLQGRYILPILPFLILALSGWTNIALRYKKITMILLSFMFIGLMSQSIFLRYYDYSRVFDTAELLLTQEKDLQNMKEHTSIILTDTQSFVYEVKYPQYKIGGFQMLLNVDEKHPVNVPYRYELRNADCTKTIRSGYLDQTELHRPHIYTQLLPITPLKEDRICVRFTPLYGPQDMQYLPLVTQDSKPVINFLYIKK